MYISYGKQSIDSSDIKSVVKALKSDFLTQGPLVEEFENKIKNLIKSNFATVVSNGSVALFLAGHILNWKKGDLVAVPPITFVASVNTIEHHGAKPLFVDISLKDYCMDPDKLEIELKKDKSKKIKAAIITDFGGQPAQWEKFYRLKNKYKIHLINDNCHSLGSSIKGDRGYAVKYADIVTLSFHPVKAITTGEGGAILTNNKVYDQKFKLFRSHYIQRKDSNFWKYKVNNLGYNFRLPDINCALGVSQIKRIEKFLKKRKLIANFYNKIFVDKTKFKTPSVIQNTENSYHLYPLLVNFDKLKTTKDKIIKQFLKENIKLQVHYIPVNSQPYFLNRYGLIYKKFKNSFEFYKREISLPIHYDLNKNNLNYIKKICKKIFKIN